MEEMHSCDRFSIVKLTTSNWTQANYYIMPPDPEESLISSLIMDGCTWRQYTATYLPSEIQLDQPAFVHPDIIPMNLDIPFVEYYYQKPAN
jgi:hypothetical protein